MFSGIESLRTTAQKCYFFSVKPHHHKKISNESRSLLPSGWDETSDFPAVGAGELLMRTELKSIRFRGADGDEDLTRDTGQTQTEMRS